MKIIILGKPEGLSPVLEAHGYTVLNETNPVTPDTLRNAGVDFIISYGYRHILKREVLDLFKERVINLHISLLPWNRGADPNLWSFLENTPKGVSIHQIDEGLDTGDILLQKEVTFNKENETLASTYEALQEEILLLFRKNFKALLEGKIQGKKQSPGLGSFHRLKDKTRFEHLLTQGWDTKVKEIAGKALCR